MSFPKTNCKNFSHFRNMLLILLECANTIFVCQGMLGRNRRRNPKASHAQPANDLNSIDPLDKIILPD